MKTLSYTCIALAAIALTFSSCSKKSSNNPTPNGTVTSSMKLKLNGTDLNFNDCEEIEADVNNQKQTTITGYIITDGKPGDVNFGLNITHDPATLKAGQTYLAQSSYGQDDVSSFFYWKTSSDYYTSQPTVPAGNITITGVTATTISGTFSGKLFAPNDFQGMVLYYTITNGTFTAKINK
ncbi:hypothetical protein [Mucilaginibacter sp. BT774]|uniref:hypothetical protein n=1 Tax=Mucilaginibacter sp. BT774 TaxID=3062276 RepID=UPI002675267A|nr:hypothetical protein [Mucilaginibacter sp. BT774]MDO3627144.1 hypothetical protein [Mucilaginibacter sp. BT774]